MMTQATILRAVPCRAVPCRAVPCRAVPCRAVPCRAVPCRQKRIRTTFFCQPLSAQFYRKPRDRDVRWRRRTVPISIAVFLCYHSGLDPGG